MYLSLSVINFMVALALFSILLYNRSRLVEQNWIERVGHNVMAIAVAIISVKVGYCLAVYGAASFDIYGLLFRAGFLIFMLGNLYSTSKYGISLMYKSQQAQCFVVIHDTATYYQLASIEAASLKAPETMFDDSTA